MRGVRSVPSLAIVLALLLGACGGGVEDEVAARAEIQAMLESYLPELATAYSQGDARRLLDWVAEKEVARVAKLIADLEDEGRRLEPEFESVTVEDVKIWGNSNAFVTTLEVWTVKSVTLGSGQVVQEVPEKSTRVRYQMKRDGGQWRVLFRTIAD
jgi:Fe-S cluster biogenesis protein NfuA